MRPERPATDEAPGREREPTPEPVISEGLGGVLRAARVEAAGRNPSGCRSLIGLYHPDRGPHRPAHHIFAVHGCTCADAAARWSARCTSATNASGRSLAAAGSTRSRYAPRGRVGAIARADSRMRRRSELRTTAWPQCFPIAYPTWGYTPGESGPTGTKAARTGPQLARARERCSCPKVARV